MIERKKVCPRATFTIDINHPLHPNFSEGKSIQFHIRSGSVNQFMSKTQLRISPNHKTGYAMNRTIFNEQSVKSDSEQEQNYDINQLTNRDIKL